MWLLLFFRPGSIDGNRKKRWTRAQQQETREQVEPRITHSFNGRWSEYYILNRIKMSIKVLFCFVFLALKLTKIRTICTRIHKVHAFKCISIFVLFVCVLAFFSSSLIYELLLLFLLLFSIEYIKYCWIQPGALVTTNGKTHFHEIKVINEA